MDHERDNMHKTSNSV